MTQLALVIDLNVCVGCHACVTSCKEWNTSGWAGPVATRTPTAPVPPAPSSTGCRPSRSGDFPHTETVHFPKSCLHCEEPPCVPVCPTGASYKRAGQRHRAGRLRQVHRLQVLLLGLPLRRAGARREQKVMKKCTLCIDRIHDLTPARGRPQAGLRPGLPDQRAPLRRRPRPGLRGLASRSASAAAMR